jgi:hypothetical protein
VHLVNQLRTIFTPVIRNNTIGAQVICAAADFKREKPIIVFRAVPTFGTNKSIAASLRIVFVSIGPCGRLENNIGCGNKSSLSSGKGPRCRWLCRRAPRMAP